MFCQVLKIAFAGLEIKHLIGVGVPGVIVCVSKDFLERKIVSLG